MIIHLIGVDKEGAVVRRSAAFGEISSTEGIPTGCCETEQKIASGYVMRVVLPGRLVLGRTRN
jgi:hypothetical protein